MDALDRLWISKQKERQIQRRADRSIYLAIGSQIVGCRSVNTWMDGSMEECVDGWWDAFLLLRRLDVNKDVCGDIWISIRLHVSSKFWKEIMQNVNIYELYIDKLKRIWSYRYDMSSWVTWSNHLLFIDGKSQVKSSGVSTQQAESRRGQFHRTPWVGSWGLSPLSKDRGTWDPFHSWPSLHGL